MFAFEKKYFDSLTLKQPLGLYVDLVGHFVDCSQSSDK
jgi:hypothetical protein